MDTEQFLARVIPPGNYLAVGYNRTPGQTGAFSHRFFPEEELANAARFIRWASGKGFDVYHAMASYTVATPDGQDGRGVTKFRGERTQANAQRLRAFWVDLDVKRDGDKKKPDQVFASQRDALAWLLGGFLAATGLPRPNLAVSSGYGLHVYWVLEDAMLAADWQPYADALKAALIQHGFKGDAGISADSARILRPPGSNNMKGAAPAPVVALPKLAAGDYPNPMILQLLQPYVGLLSKVAVGQAGQGTASALAGGGGTVSSIFAGTQAGNMAAATGANLAPRARPREFARIASKCQQVEQSLASHGNGDAYPLWYLGHLSLAHHCADGAAFVHPISDGDPRYTAHATDTAFHQVAREHARKGNGPPSCAHYERARPGICAGCPHFGRVHSPWDLGVEDGDLPDRYRRGPQRLEVNVRDAQTKEWIWLPVVPGDVSGPVLDELESGGYALSFTYNRGATSRAVHVVGVQLTPDSATIYRMFEPQGVTLLPQTELRWRGFILAWIDKLREQRAERRETIYPFGWAKDNKGAHSGFAVAGTLFRPDGRAEATPGGDPMMVSRFKPRGTLAAWQQACDFVTAGRPDLQTIVAAAFGSPLMRFTGHSGVIVSAWSRQSGVGKSSAMKVGQAVWSAVNLMNSLDDTPNSVFKKVAIARAMPCYWDEMRVSADNVDKVVSMAFSLSQGKEKGRMNADTSLREVGEWDTILMTASNAPLMDHITSQTDGTEAGALRVFEFNITIPPTQDSAQAARTIAQVRDNYGSAGLAYAKWLAENYDRADKIVCTYKDLLNTELQAEQSERLHIAAMSAMLAGAKIANHVGLTKFDIPALKAFLCGEFHRLRAARHLDVIVSSKGYDLDQVIGSFMAEMVGNKVVTSRFNNRGSTQRSGFQIIWHPQDRRRVTVHVAQAEKILRIDRTAFYEWCRKKGYAASDVVESMRHAWGVTTAKRVIAGGTGFGGGQIFCLDIPLNLPELEDYLYADPSLQQTPQQQQAPAAALKGNQPRVV